MTTTTKRTRKPTDRHATLSRMTHGKTLLWITQDGKVYGYILTEIPTEIGGVAFNLGKATEDGCSESYDVLIHGRETSCTCPGHTFHHHCKHASAIEALLNARKLSAALRQPKPVLAAADMQFENP
jgi:hypothetical protein